MTRNRYNISRILLYLLITGILAVFTAVICQPDSIIKITGHPPADMFTSGYADYRSYITPNDQAVIHKAASLSDIEDAYALANTWIYVSETRLNGTTDKWLTPGQFLSDTPTLETNPVMGTPVSDCEEQANTLVSILRAMGVPAKEVRVVLGEIPSADINKGHVWVEIYHDGKWLALDPRQGPHWDDDLDQLMHSRGVAFTYYADHEYPVPDVTAYYNDKYYMDLTGGRGNAPPLWKE